MRFFIVSFLLSTSLLRAASSPPPGQFSANFRQVTNTVDAAGLHATSTNFTSSEGHVGGIVDVGTQPTSANFNAHYGYLAQINYDPQITSALRDMVYIKSTYSYQVQCDTTPTGFSATGLPTWATINATTGVISGAPDVAGDSNIVLTVNTASGSAKSVLYLTVLPEPPVIPDNLVAAGVVGSDFRYELPSSGLGGISFKIDGLPLDLRQEGTVIVGKPTFAGETVVNVTATHITSSQQVQTSTKTVTIRILPSGSPQILEPLEKSGIVGVNMSYSLTATGTAPITFTATSALPAGLALNGSTISGSPGEAGVFDVTLEAANGVSKDTKTVRIAISNPGTPVLTRPLEFDGEVGIAFSGAAVSASDVVSGTLIFASDGCPPGISFSANTFSGTPTAAGLYPVLLKVFNRYGEADFVVAQFRVKPSSADFFGITVTDVNISCNPARTTTPVVFTPVIFVPGNGQANITSYSWFFFQLDGTPLFNGKPFAGDLNSGGALTHTFDQEGEFYVGLKVRTETETDQTLKKFYVVPLQPNAVEVVENITSGTEAIENPDTHEVIQVAESISGVLTFDLSVAAGRSRAGDTFNTQLPNRVAKNESGAVAGSGRFRGSRTAEKFSAAKIHVVDSTRNGSDGTEQGRVRRMVPVSAREIGQQPGQSGETIVEPAKEKRVISKAQPKGKFNFGNGKKDSLSFSGNIEMPAGVNMNLLSTFSIGVGNVYADISVDPKGRGQNKEVTFNQQTITFSKVSIKVSKLDSKTKITKAGNIATVKFTVTGNNLSTAGFDSEGISNKGTPSKTAVARKLQSAIVIAGVSYYSILKVDYKFDKGTGSVIPTRTGR